MAQQTLVGQGLDIIEASRSHSVKRTTVGRIPLTSEQLSAGTSTWQHTTITRDRHPFEPAIPTSERLHTHALKRAANGVIIRWEIVPDFCEYCDERLTPVKCDNFVTSWVTNSFLSYTSVEYEHSLPSLPEIATGTIPETNEYRWH